MDVMLVIRGRTVSVRTEILALKAQNRALRSEVTPNPQTVPLFLRFMPFEKKLLADLTNLLIPERAIEEIKRTISLDDVVARLFFKWQWASDVLHQTLTDLHPREVDEDHHGDQHEAFEMVLTMLRVAKNGGFTDYRYQRTEQFVVDNVAFMEKLGAIDVENIAFFPHPEDADLWRLLAYMFINDMDTVSNWPGFKEDYDDESDDESQIESDEHEEPAQDPMSSPTLAETMAANASREVDALLRLENTWTVWQFCRLFWLLKSRPENDQTLQDFVSLDCFRDHWQQVQIDNEDEDGSFFRGYLPRQKFESEMLHEIVSFFEDHFSNHVTHEYRKLKHNRSLLDPYFCLQYIPYDELEVVQDEILINDLHNLLGLHLENSANGEPSFVLWTPLQGFQGLHGFYFSEDLFAHELRGEFNYPGFEVDGRIFYKCTKVEGSSLCRDLRQYWSSWNDVRLTRDPKSQIFYILETLPGIKLRHLSAAIDTDAAQAFLATLLRYQQGESALQETYARDLLGSDYDPSYQYTLRYIDAARLSDAQPAPIGEGSFGKVYKCFWPEKPAQRGDIGAVESGFVALKIPAERGDGYQRMSAKFLKELRLAHSALSGNDTGFIRFFGFTRVFIDDAGLLSLESHGSGAAVFALLFEYATEGTVLDYLQGRLRPNEWRWNWLQLSSALETTAEGLNLLHKRGVLHRDIHPNNVLVTKEQFKNTSDVAYSCYLSDIGEGKSITSSTESSEQSFIQTDRRFGVREYQAPEISTHGYSWMSDMYAWAQLGVDMIRFNNQLLSDPETGKLRVPEKLLHVLDCCLAHDVKDRYEAILVVRMLEEVSYKLNTDDEIVYVEEENLSQYFPHRQLSSWDSSSV